jgi:DNA-binding CsgD family transcriptional regulator
MELFEREEALATLTRLLEEARAGAGRLALVAGEAGIGKSALVDGFCGGLPPQVRVLRGACDPLSTPRPLGPLLEIATTVGGELSDLLRAGSSADALFECFLRVLAGSRQPTVLVLEDVNWADEATLDLLCFVGRRVSRTRTFGVVTFRDDELDAAHPLRVALGNLPGAPVTERLRLAPLSEGAVAVLAHGRFPDARRLHRLTGGNPFFVTEVLAAGGRELPDTARDAVLARTAPLPADARAALELLAAFGRPADRPLLARLGVDEEATDAGIARGLLRRTGGRVEFRHELARSAIVEAVPGGRLAGLHGRILAVLRSPGSAPAGAAVLAYHAEEACDADAVVVYAAAAAQQAERLSSHREAAAQYARALRFADALPLERRAELCDACSRESFLSADVAGAIESARVALGLRRTLGDRLGVGSALAQLAMLVWHTEDKTEAVPLAREAIAVLEEQPPGRELAAAYAMLASLHAAASEMDKAVAYAGRALRLADLLDLAGPRIRALRALGIAKLCGPGEDGWPELELALAGALDADLPVEAAGIYAPLVWFGAMHRAFDRFERYFDEALAFAERHNLDEARANVLQSRCVELVHRGRWTEAGELAQALLAAPGGGLVDRIQPLYVLGRLRARRGDPETWAPLDEALELSAPRSELQHLGNVRAVRAEAAWLEGDATGMVGEAGAAYPLAVPVRDPWILGELALWLWRGGALGEADPVLAGNPYGLQIAGDWEGAAGAWERLGCPFEAAAALLDGDEPALRRALQIFDGLGARPAAAMAARRLRELGVRGVPRGAQRATRSDPHNLTLRQQEILALLAEGLSDAEIAERLFLARKTVSHHVSAVLAKLGVRSRGEAAALVK